MSAADLIRGVTTEELREIANVIASTPLPAKMGAVVDSLLALVIEGRESQTFRACLGWDCEIDTTRCNDVLRALAGDAAAGSREEDER